MSRDYPKHCAVMMSEGGDADTADVFVQCVVFGKVVYGWRSKPGPLRGWFPPR